VYLGGDEAAEGVEVGDGDGHLGLVVGVAVCGGAAGVQRPREVPVRVRLDRQRLGHGQHLRMSTSVKKKREETLPQIMVWMRREGESRAHTLKRNGRSAPQRAATARPRAAGLRASQSRRETSGAREDGADGCVPIQSSAQGRSASAAAARRATRESAPRRPQS
jgi:hypothetical protein